MGLIPPRTAEEKLRLFVVLLCAAPLAIFAAGLIKEIF